MPVLRTLDDIWGEGPAAGHEQRPLTQSQVDVIAVILAPYRAELARLGRRDDRRVSSPLAEPEQPAAQAARMLTVAEACDQLGIGLSKAYELIRNGDLKAVDLNNVPGQYAIPGKPGKRRCLRIDQPEIDAFKASGRPAQAAARQESGIVRPGQHRPR